MVEALPHKPRLEAIERWPTAESKTWTERFLELAHADENIIAVIAVGSAVRRNVPSADLDLVVLLKDVQRLKTRPPIEVDLRAYPIDAVDGLIEAGNDLLGWAVMYGRALFQRHSSWDQIVKRWRNSVPIPSVDVATKRASDAARRYESMVELDDHDAAYEQALSYVTHLARAELLTRKIYPASRPELPGQLRAIGSVSLADDLQELLSSPSEDVESLAVLVQRASRHCTGSPRAESSVNGGR